MSFASEVKRELTSLEMDDCCTKAELTALILMNSVVSEYEEQFTLDLQTENAAIARRIYVLIKSIYSHSIELLVRKKMRLKKNNVYIIRLLEDVDPFLKSLKIIDDEGHVQFMIAEEVVQKECCKKAYLRGAFLAGGSINNPETSSYHLEVFNFTEEHNSSLCQLFNFFDLRARELRRRNGYIIYIKEAEKITEFLILIGAHNALFKFEDVRIVRDLRNTVNRLVNCETANLNKTISAAIRQTESIKLIDEEIGLEALPDRLQEIARVRLEHEDATLKELGELVKSGKISKSGVNHRLKKIDEIAKKIKEGKKIEF